MSGHLLVVVAALLWMGGLRGQGADTGLDSLADQVNKAREADYALVVSKLDAAAQTPQSAQGYFFECVQKLDFKKDLEVPAKFENWKRDFMEQWRGHDLGIVLQMQLQFQSLVLRAAVDKKVRPAMVPQWLRYVEGIVSHGKDAAYGSSFLAQPVNSSIFNKALKLQQLGGSEGFTVGAMNLGGIFDVYIHPYVKPENRMSAWQRRIELQKKFSEEVLLPTELEDFASFELPRLQWRSLMEVKFAEGSKDPAAPKEAAQFIQQHLHHPDAKRWLEMLRSASKAP